MPQWNVQNDGNQWLTDANGVLIGYRDNRGVDHLIPQTIAPASDGTSVPVAGVGGGTRTFRGAVANQAAMLALSSAVVGDWCTRTDLAGQVFELTTAGPSTLGNWTAYPAGGVATFAALTDRTTVDIPATNGPTASALALKANAAAPVLTGIVTHAGADLVVGVPVSGNVVDFAVGENTLTLTSAPTLTFGGSPSTGQRTTLVLTGDTVARVVTLPANVRSAIQQAVIASFTVPTNWTGTIFLKKSAAGYDIDGEPTALAFKGWSSTFDTGANDTRYVTNSSPLAGTITLFTTQCASGTASYQLAINGVNVTGGSNAVSSTKVNNVPSTGNVVAVGDEITIVRTADATCVGARWAVRVAPATL